MYKNISHTVITKYGAAEFIPLDVVNAVTTEVECSVTLQWDVHSNENDVQKFHLNRLDVQICHTVDVHSVLHQGPNTFPGTSEPSLASLILSYKRISTLLPTISNDSAVW